MFLLNLPNEVGVAVEQEDVAPSRSSRQPAPQPAQQPEAISKMAETGKQSPAGKGKKGKKKK